MKPTAKNIFAASQPNGKGYQVSYEIGSSRKVHPFENSTPLEKQPPHGAGSYHDPDQHFQLMTSLADYIAKGRS